MFKFCCLTIYLTDMNRIYNDKISQLEKELAELSGPSPSHAEFLRQQQCIQQYRDKKVDFEERLFSYKTTSLKQKSVSERSTILSSYFQRVREIRDEHLEGVSKAFYKLQRDRFKTEDSVPHYAIPFATRRSQQVQQQTAFNKEVSLLAGIAKYVGFPAGPSIEPVRQQDMEDDFEKMGVSLAAPRLVSRAWN